VRYKRRSHRDYQDDEESIGDDLAAINDRLDDLSRQLERTAPAGRHAGSRGESSEQSPIDRKKRKTSGNTEER
jgi:uncharacterized protein YukE